MQGQQKDANSPLEGVESNESVVFIHEVLDHGLDVINNRSVNDNHKSKKGKVSFENKARREMNMKERTGEEHQ